MVGLHGDALVVAHAAPPGAARANFAGLPVADRSLVNGDARVLARGDEARALHARACDEWRALTACALVGLGRRAFEIGLDYLKEREQFDRPLAAFQALQHGMADLAVALDGARLLALEAAWSLDDEPERAPALAGMALAYARETASDTAYRAMHYHGGVGVSDEYDIQLYYRRARGWALVAGDPSEEIDRLADHVLGPRGGGGG